MQLMRGREQLDACGQGAGQAEGRHGTLGNARGAHAVTWPAGPGTHGEEMAEGQGKRGPGAPDKGILAYTARPVPTEEAEGLMQPKIPRRTILQGATAAAGLAAVNLAPRAQETTVERSWFAGVSAVLTGIAETALNPPKEPGALAGEFEALCRSGLEDGIERLAAVEEAYTKGVERGDAPDEIAADVQALDPQFSRMVMKLWLLGQWQGGQEQSGVTTIKWNGSGCDTDFIVAGLAARRGWVWRIAQSHAAGYSHFGTNSWAQVPPSLADYGITTVSNS